MATKPGRRHLIVSAPNTDDGMRALCGIEYWIRHTRTEKGVDDVTTQLLPEPSGKIELDDSRLDVCDIGSDYGAAGRVPVFIPDVTNAVAADMRSIRDIFKPDL